MQAKRVSAVVLLCCLFSAAAVPAAEQTATDVLQQLRLVLSSTPGDGVIRIDGPTECDVGQLVRLTLAGLPPINTAETLDEALKWLKTIRVLLDQTPGLDKPVPVELLIRLVPTPQLSWRVDVEFTPPVSGDYVVAVDWNETPNQLLTHRVRAGQGPVPPPDEPMLEVTPLTPFGSKGPPGGPFDPPGVVYMLRNTGGGVLLWQATVSADWLVVSPPSGMIVAGQSVSVSVGTGPKANTLPVGMHPSIASFKNLSNGKGDTMRLAVLTVEGEPPPPPVQKLWGIVIEESMDRTNAQAVVLTSEEVRSLFDGVRFRVIDKDSAKGDLLKQWIDGARGKVLPHLFLANQVGGIVWEGPLPSTVAEMVELVKKFLPKLPMVKTAAVLPAVVQSADKTEAVRFKVIKPKTTTYRRVCEGGVCRMVPVEE